MGNEIFVEDQRSLVELGFSPEAPKIERRELLERGGASVDQHWRVIDETGRVWRAKQVASAHVNWEQVPIASSESFAERVIGDYQFLLEGGLGPFIPETRFLWETQFEETSMRWGWIFMREISGNSLAEFEQLDEGEAAVLCGFLEKVISLGESCKQVGDGNIMYLPDLLGGYRRKDLPQELQNLMVDEEGWVWLVDVWPLIKIDLGGEPVLRWRYAAHLRQATRRELYGRGVSELGEKLAELVYSEDRSPGWRERLVFKVLY